MRLKALVLKNFRAYKGDVTITFDHDLTAFIGRNDVGKSSILDALAIFFDSPLVKLEPQDLCVHASDKELRIGCIFDQLPAALTLDASSVTTLSDEHLLNEDGDLEIHKVFDCSLKSPKLRIVARAVHPTANGYADLLLRSNSELKNLLQSRVANLETVDKRSNPSLRQALWKSCNNLELAVTEIDLNKEDAKKIWDRIQEYLPIFALFRADRPSTDEDSEVQDPMKMAIRQAISELGAELQEIQDRVRDSAMDVARRTMEKLSEIDHELARELTPTFRAEPKWDTLFKLALTTDDQIPVNKRGSGTRRLILLGFFRAEADRRLTEAGRTNVIYAIEEPETSQHPSNQQVVIEALKDLSSAEGCQVIITTHVPGLAQMIPITGLRYVRVDEHGRRVIEAVSDSVLASIADDLGVIPDNRVRVFVCVEGPNDITFLKNLARLLKEAGDKCAFDPDAPEIAFLPLGGATLRDWVNSHYLKQLGRPEIHIYDRGDDSPPKYLSQVETVNKRADGSKAFLTKKSEAENYLHPEAIRQVLQVDVEVNDDNDVPEAVARAIHSKDKNARPWEEVDAKKKKIDHAKRRLNNEVWAVMTMDMLRERNALDEIRIWFGTIISLCNT